jgi:GDP-4-dehydro-6-deoxy-D-mannose reductase
MNTQRIVITGINGFVGHHLARELASHSISVIGIGQDENVTPELRDITTEYYSANLTEEWPKIENVDGVIHLAGLAAVGPSFDKPQLYINANSAMVTNMCESFLTQDKKPRILVISSGAIYSPDQEMPITEDSKVGFSSPYAVSKILTENQCTYYRNRGLDCIVVRPFNHIGPGQGGGFLLPDITTGLLEAKQSNTSLLVGNLKSKRDYTDVRDVVKAYYLLATTPSLSHTIYNVCSGKSVSGEEILAHIQKITGITDVPVKIDQNKIRPNDPANIYGSSTWLQNDTEWKPSVPLVQTISDYIQDRV